MKYTTVKQRCEVSFTEKKSEFITCICPASSEEEAIGIINGIRTANRKATHNCYAYILRENNISRHSDDGEPGGTAGAPIYEVLSHARVTDVVCVVTRYFGGILLGTGGLVRAYSKGAAMALDAAKLICMQTALSIRINADYSLYGAVTAVINEHGGIVRDTVYADSIQLFADIRSDVYDIFLKKLTDKCRGKVTPEVISEGWKEFDG